MELPWISIKDKEPEDGQRVFTAAFAGYIWWFETGSYSKTEKMCFINNAPGFAFDYWLPCVPPKGD